MKNFFSKIGSRLMVLGLMNLAVLSSGCPYGEDNLEDPNSCAPAGMGKLDFDNKATEAASVAITTVPNPLSIPPVELAAGAQDAIPLSEGVYSVLVTGKMSGKVLLQKQFTIDCGESIPVEIDDASLSWKGIKQFGVKSSDTSPYSVATDPDGNIYVVGSTTGNLDKQTIHGTQDAFITSYAPSGERRWTFLLGASSPMPANTSASGVAIDPAGKNVYVVGTTSGNLSGEKLTGMSDAFVASFTTDGIQNWVHLLGTSFPQPTLTFGSDVTTASNGDVYVAGSTWGNLDGNTREGAEDLFIASYTASGEKNWTTTLGCKVLPGQLGTTNANGITTDHNGNIYVVGATGCNLDGNILAGKADAFIASYTPSGAKTKPIKNWTRSLGTSPPMASVETVANGVSVNIDGDIYMVGDTLGNLDGNALIGTQDAFVARYTPSGVQKPVYQFGVDQPKKGGTSIAGITIDPNGNIYLTGSAGGYLDNNPLVGTSDAFVKRYDQYGSMGWTRQFGAALPQPSATTAFGVATDASGNVYAVGDTRGDLDGNMLIGTKDGFIARFSPSGAKQKKLASPRRK